MELLFQCIAFLQYDDSNCTYISRMILF